MNKIESYGAFNRLIEAKETFMLYGNASSCGVCDVFMPLVNKLANKYTISLYVASIEELPKIRGQLFIFTVPLVALFCRGREYHRQARFININELEKRIKEITYNMPD